ncbi:ATP-binding protein [Agromyces bracchium]|uniref:AAA family ATPase n=1 Tax=Agromyces bracchium TaxID=88376 RepID=A0A6I3MG20_9MICO|nr:ATP-binding protein [Agromyces bracchium]MTH70316.1 AAA family ATPase [Agromyces bracchium]
MTTLALLDATAGNDGDVYEDVRDRVERFLLRACAGDASPAAGWADVDSLVAGDPLRLGERLALDPVDQAIVALAVVTELEPRLGDLLDRVSGFLLGSLTVDLVVQLLHGEDSRRLDVMRRLSSEAPLVATGLLVDCGPDPGPRSLIRTTPGTIAGVLGAAPIPDVAGPRHGLSAAQLAPIEHAWNRALATMIHPRLVLFGSDDHIRRGVASALAAQVDRPLIALTDAAAGAAEVRRARRDAALAGGVLYGVSPAHVEGLTAPAILGSGDPLPGAPAVAVPDVDDGIRLGLWASHLGGDAGLARAALARLPLDPTGIEYTAGLAAGLGAARRRRPGLADITTAAGVNAARRLTRFATTVPADRKWKDLIVAPSTRRGLDELTQRVRQRAAELPRRTAPPAGISALFAGSSGVGKSMAASVVAGRIGIPLWRVELARVVSKYIGETEQNLEEVFSAAESAAAMLLFDEADALFGKRSEVQDARDRYANLEISYLLQRMETFRGVVVLSTNLARHLDAAFARRLTFVIHFPFPDEDTRQKLWRAMLPGERAGGARVSTAELARHPLSGANIASAVETALHLAHTDGVAVSHELVERAIAQELAKLGGPTSAEVPR